MFRNENKVALHCRKVLIDAEPKSLFPEWLRFLKGVVDSSDLPLNVSRESMQDSDLLRKLNQVLTKRFLRFLAEQAKKEEETYLEFWKEFGVLIKEGAATDYTYREDLAKLLLFESTAMDAGKLTGLDAYIDRMAKDQKEILFLFWQKQGVNRSRTLPRGNERPRIGGSPPDRTGRRIPHANRPGIQGQENRVPRIRRISNLKNWIRKRTGTPWTRKRPSPCANG